VFLPERDNDFGAVSRLVADAVGKPGQRAFRVLVESGPRSACLWVEREQLQALAMLIEQLLSGWPAIQIQAERGAASTKKRPQTPFPAAPDVDFRVGQLALGYDDRNSVYVLLARSVESDNEQEADFTCQATRAQLRALSETIPPLLAAGRPRCPMCEAPLGRRKHNCARSNGHIRGLEK
jgi:uncharacterized repeat protein (TIGR03847 family)